MGVDDQDGLLREALATYAGYEPRPGIEKRVLRRARTPGLARRSGWTLAGLAAACVIVTIVIPREEKLEIALPALASPLPVSVKIEVPRAIGRPERFPTPAPLTREERILLALADTAILTPPDTEEISPIRIENITIPPIGE